MKLFIILSVVAMAGCENKHLVPEAHHFKCSSEQEVRMKRELDTCNTTSYYSSYCYKMAKSLYCEDIRK